MWEKVKRLFLAKVLKKHYYRTGKCKGCGQCCTHIYVKHFKHVLQDEKEFERLQYIHKFYSDLKIIGKDELGLIFECKNLRLKMRAKTSIILSGNDETVSWRCAL